MVAGCASGGSSHRACRGDAWAAGAQWMPERGVAQQSTGRGRLVESMEDAIEMERRCSMQRRIRVDD